MNRLYIVILSLVATNISFADSMNLETHNTVISKFERSLQLTNKDNISKQSLLLRLGDLYSEKARLQEIDAVEKKCDKCKDALNSRKIALNYYQKAMQKGTVNGEVILQMAHLYGLTNQTHKSKNLYQTVINKGTRHYSKDLVGQAYRKLAELEYNKANYKKSESLYLKSLNYPLGFKKGYTRYQLAWTYLNLGKTEKAKQSLIFLLGSQAELQTRKEEPIDKLFQEQVAKDLSVFFARGKVNIRDIQALYDLSPENMKLDNIKNLANEIERLGGFYSAIDVWRFYSAQSQNKLSSLESEVHIAELFYKLYKYTATQNQLKKVKADWSKQGCNDKEICKNLKERLRNLVVSWHQNQKHKPTQSLLNSYVIYLDMFSEDIEMSYWAAQLAFEIKIFTEARRLFRLAHSNINNSNENLQNKFLKLKTSALVGEVESAENTNNKELRLDTYSYFLKFSSNEKQKDEVRYQIAYIYYEQKKYDKAENIFNNLVLSKYLSYDFKKKSADLNLDILALLKKDNEVETNSLRYSQILKANAIDYLKIYRKSLYNQASKASSNSSIKTLIAKFEMASLKGADLKEKVIFYNNLVVLNQKILNIMQALKYNSILVRFNGLSNAEKSLYLKQRVALAETILDFKTSFHAKKTLQSLSKTSDDDLLNLALIADLAGYNAIPYYENFIDKTSSRTKANLARAEVILMSKYSWGQFHKLKTKLKSTPSIYSNSLLNVYAKYPYSSHAKKALTDNSLMKTDNGLLINRLINSNNIYQLKNNIAKHRLIANSQRLMARSIEKRGQLLGKLEENANHMIAIKDDISQIAYLTVLSHEYKRFYDNLLALPLPRTLKANQINQYKTALRRQASPYLLKHQQIENKLANLWNTKFYKKYIELYKNSEPRLRTVYLKNLKLLKDFAPNILVSEIESAMNTQFYSPSTEQITLARNKLAEQPNNQSRIKNLIKLEKARGNYKLVTYLNSRLNKKLFISQRSQ